MVDRKKTVFTFIALSIGIGSVVLFYCGIGWGFRHEAIMMGLCFFLAVYSVDACVGLLLNLKIDTSFTRLEDLVSGKSDSVPLRNSINIMHIFMIVVLPALLFLSMLACHYQYWLLMCIFMSVFVITSFISDGVLIARRINAYSRRLEELISRDKDGEASKDKSGE